MPWAEPYYNSLLWQLIGQQSRRWKTIELLDVHPLAYAKLNGLSYTNLRSLLLKMGDEDTAMTQVHAFDDAPDLRSLEIRDTVDFELSPSWRLHTLEIAYVPPAHGHALNKPFLGSILPCSQTLRKLVLDAEIVGDRAPVHPTIFPSLEELELTDGAVYIMESIIRPSNLHTLVLRQDILDREDTTNTLDIEPGDVIELAAALQRDRTRPESLAFLPDLTHLTLRFDYMMNTHFPRILGHAEQSRSPANPCTLDGRQLAYLEQLRTW
ncbi:hypothetical protein GGF50DRAFT_114169 [Schizophyllum commune]